MHITHYTLHLAQRVEEAMEGRGSEGRGEGRRGDGGRAECREQVQRMYQRYNPKKLEDASFLSSTLTKYEGREAVLVKVRE
jgi:hypothetical protein